MCIRDRNKDEIDFAYLNRPHIATKYVDFIKENTNIKVIYYGHDLHFLRLGREYACLLYTSLGYFTASVNVFFKDMAQIVGICLQFGIWLSPIMYHESMFTDRMPWMEPIFKLNPFYYIVTGYKDSMICLLYTSRCV